jgi:hypothetical protein
MQNGTTTVNNELKIMWKEAVAAYFNMISMYITGGIDEYYDTRVIISDHPARIRTWDLQNIEVC